MEMQGAKAVFGALHLPERQAPVQEPGLLATPVVVCVDGNHGDHRTADHLRMSVQMPSCVGLQNLWACRICGPAGSVGALTGRCLQAQTEEGELVPQAGGAVSGTSPSPASVMSPAGFPSRGLSAADGEKDSRTPSRTLRTIIILLFFSR